MRPNSDFSSADGALLPELEVGEVKVRVLPLISAGVMMSLSAGTMISISYPKEPSSDAIMANGTKPAQLTAIGLLPVLNPAICRRPERMASNWAAFDCTEKKRTFLPVIFSIWSMKPAHTDL